MKVENLKEAGLLRGRLASVDNDIRSTNEISIIDLKDKDSYDFMTLQPDHCDYASEVIDVVKVIILNKLEARRKEIISQIEALE